MSTHTQDTPGATRIKDGERVRWDRQWWKVVGFAGAAYELEHAENGQRWRGLAATVDRNNPDSARVPLTE